MKVAYPNSTLLERRKEQVPPRDFIWTNFERGTVGALVGESGIGKSFFALQAAFAVAAGNPADTLALGVNQTKSGPVLYISMEDSEEEVYERFENIWNYIPKRARSILDETSQLGLSFPMLNDSILRYLQEDKTPFRLIILDTLSQVHDGRENESEDMLRLMKWMKQIAAEREVGILFLHHLRKVQGRYENIQDRVRGSSALLGSVRWCAALERDSRDQNVLIYKEIKNNSGEKVRDRAYYQGKKGIIRPIDSTDSERSNFRVRVRS